MQERDPWAKYIKRNQYIYELYHKNLELNMADIARMFKISRERVRQILEREKEREKQKAA